MKKTPTLTRKWSKLTGKILTILLIAIPAHAQPSMSTPLEPSEQGTKMSQTVTDSQRETALGILTTAMAILRENQPFDPAHVIFGRHFATNPAVGPVGREYAFENPSFPATQITLLMEGDPSDCKSNHTTVKLVPTVFTIRFSPLMAGISRSTLEDLYPLARGYWIDSSGNRQPGNDLGTTPPQVLLHGYRYRASSQPTSKFPVDVELAFGDPNPHATKENARKTPVLMDVILSRDYSQSTSIRR
ncbi:hypothetical protein LJ656_03595 [Paraburkholderia sp. MMS20-SJTR3]|uniref:Uncharacterized protein n=1 Tax=Paraburkholderia sejongensis TaxID=2886946 RepID=A0ABS8JPA9_9BURK|nr:hypothetical protein [Paraburkholderia sp. MMS20-SJTR3]MCC8391662.1 hypothetical protein [Paraburkholderia sp. MMS20-SJTR3]